MTYKVLIIDDDPDLREVIQDALEEGGYQLFFASDGEAGLHSIRTHQPDLAIVDIMMPKVDGFGVLQAIREDPRLQFTKAIILSAKAMTEAQLEGYQLGALDYIVKSAFRGDVLREKVTRLLQMRFAEEIAMHQQGTVSFLRQGVDNLNGMLLQTSETMSEMAGEIEESGNAGNSALNLITEAAKGLDRLVHEVELLTILSTETLELGTVDLKQLLLKLVPEVQVRIDGLGEEVSFDALGKPGREFVVQIPEAGPTTFFISGEAALLSYAIMSVLDNAVMYTEAGGLVKLQLKRETNQVVISVVDNGPGVFPELIPHLFQPIDLRVGFQGGPQGLRMGLPMASLITRLCGGIITHERQEGQTIFQFAFPILEKSDVLVAAQ